MNLYPVMPLFTQVPRETVRKGVGVTLRSWIWPVYGRQNEPKSHFSVSCRATLQIPPTLFQIVSLPSSLNIMSTKVLLAEPRLGISHKTFTHFAAHL